MRVGHSDKGAHGPRQRSPGSVRRPGLHASRCRQRSSTTRRASVSITNQVARGLLESQGTRGVEAIDDAGREQVDEQLSAWRQGDCVIGEHWFLFRTNSECPLTGNAVAAVTEGAENAETAVRGFAVLTQTCDLVRHCVDRPFVEVSPFVEVGDFGHGLVGLRNLGASGWNAAYVDIGACRPPIMAHGPCEDRRPSRSIATCRGDPALELLLGKESHPMAAVNWLHWVGRAACGPPQREPTWSERANRIPRLRIGAHRHGKSRSAGLSRPRPAPRATGGGSGRPPRRSSPRSGRRTTMCWRIA